jgi:hypothetical protein
MMHIAPGINRRRAIRWIVLGTGGFLLAARQHCAFAQQRAEQRFGTFSDSLENKLSRIVELGINPVLFVALWRAAFNQVEGSNRIREQEFSNGFADVVLGASTPLQEELALVSKVLDSSIGRWALTGRIASVTSDSPIELRQRFEFMAGSWLTLRRKALMGILVILGMSHFSRESLQKDSGYPGVPEHVKSIWQDAPGLNSPMESAPK